MTAWLKRMTSVLYEPPSLDSGGGGDGRQQHTNTGVRIDIESGLAPSAPHSEEEDVLVDTAASVSVFDDEGYASGAENELEGGGGGGSDDDDDEDTIVNASDCEIIIPLLELVVLPGVSCASMPVPAADNISSSRWLHTGPIVYRMRNFTPTDIRSAATSAAASAPALPALVAITLSEDELSRTDLGECSYLWAYDESYQLLDIFLARFHYPADAGKHFREALINMDIAYRQQQNPLIALRSFDLGAIDDADLDDRLQRSLDSLRSTLPQKAAIFNSVHVSTCLLQRFPVIRIVSASVVSMFKFWLDSDGPSKQYLSSARTQAHLAIASLESAMKNVRTALKEIPDENATAAAAVVNSR